jgi:alpha-L-fucosidase
MTSPDLAWFTDARFGMFIHFGAYSAAARHEWVKSIERLTDEQYQPYIDHFDPDLYDPEDWARQAKDAGMRYMAFTTKHHDGFCLWDTDLTDYKSTNTDYGKDLVGPYVEACRAAGLKVGFYHSVIDWHHPEFPVDTYHPQRDDEEFKAATADRDITKYQDYLHGQVRELLTRYGKIDYIFYDFSYSDREDVWGGKGAEDWRSEELLALTRALQPGIIVNDRLGIPGDFATPEQYQPDKAPTADGVPVLWEACQTFNGVWGYARDNHDYKSADLVLRMLIDSVSKGGNLLMNVGPTGRGVIDARSARSLADIGAWMRLHARSIHGAGTSEFTPPADCRYTQRGNRLYLHLFAWPFGHIYLPGLAGKVEYAQFLHDASEVKNEVLAQGQSDDPTRVVGTPGSLTLTIPTRRPDVDVPVIELFLSTDS